MCTNCAVNLDQAQSDAFAEKMIGILNHSALGIMISIGYRTGLFDTMAGMEAAGSADIAAKANLNERYVREWLAAMVTGAIVHYDPNQQTYKLPAEHAAWLTRQNSPNNIAVTTQWIHVMSAVEDRIVECFRDGGGLAYSEYQRFNEVMADESHQTVVTPLIDSLLPLAAGLSQKLEEGIHVLDVGCGSGRALIAMARAYPNSTFTGYDLLPEAVKRAEDLAGKEGLTNIAFLVMNAADINDREKFDLVTTFDSVHDQADPAGMLRNIFAALKPGGTYFCQDIAGSSYVENNLDHPIAPFMYAISCTHCMSVSLGQGGAGLGAMWGRETAVRMFQDAGFQDIAVKNLDHDFINHYYVMRKQ